MIIAGKSRRGTRLRPWTAAYGEALLLLQAPEVSLVYKVVKNDVWWLACRTTDSTAATTLAAALPGCKGHVGPGVYVPLMEPGQVGAGCAFTGDHVLLMYGDTNSLKDWAAGLALPVVTPTSAMPWRSHEELAQGEERMLWRGVMGLGVVLLIAAAMFNMETANHKAQAESRLQAEPAQRTGDVAARLLRLGLVTGLAAKEDGELYLYEVQGAQESVRMHVSTDIATVLAVLPGASAIPDETGTGSTIEKGAK